MSDLPLVFMAGVLGSAHCLGMCGGFALAISGTARGAGRNTMRQLLYTAGRIFTYAALGACAGFGGWRLAQAAPWFLPVPAILALIAGVVLIHQGLTSAGVLGRRTVTGSGGCLFGSPFYAMLTGPRLVQVFLAGVFTGMLPCGLLYGMVALAASKHETLAAVVTMIVFGLGTAPMMIAAGLGGGALSHSSRRLVYTIAAWCLVFTGVVSVARGASYLAHSASKNPASATQACPFCKPAS